MARSAAGGGDPDVEVGLVEIDRRGTRCGPGTGAGTRRRLPRDPSRSGRPRTWRFRCRHRGHFDAFELQPFSESGATGNFDFSTPMGLTFRTEEAWQRYVIGYERNECVLDLEWSAIGGVISTPFGSKGKGWGVNNLQQAGRMQGKLRVNGEEITVDCPSNRDRSWGPRNF